MPVHMEAAVKAEELRERMIVDRKDFTFETVLSTDRNLLLLQRAKEKGEGMAFQKKKSDQDMIKRLR